MLVKQITCPHCWAEFPPEEILFVAEHSDLRGDAVMGPDEAVRFLPSRFTPGGDAIDARGEVCGACACPTCHLPVPRECLELPTLFVSVFGSPGSGKSYLLAAMTWELRRVMGLFRLSFSDADPHLNRKLTEMEEALFLNPDADTPAVMQDLIAQTEVAGEGYSSVTLGGRAVRFTKPYLFTLRPGPGHPNEGKSRQAGRVLCLYDNAGESFQPGADSAEAPVTRHLARSRALLFVFDPTQDPRFRKAAGITERPGMVGRQESVLQEAASRVRKFAGLGAADRHEAPLIVVLTKFDRWAHLVGDALPPEPVLEADGVGGLDRAAVEARSAAVRATLARLCPEVVQGAEGFCRTVLYVPTSAVGAGTKLNADGDLPTLRPADAEPHWVTVPMLWALAKATRGLVPVGSRSG